MSLHLEVLKDYYSKEFICCQYTAGKPDPVLHGKTTGYVQPVKDDYHNESVEDYVRKVFEKNKMVEYRNTLDPAN